MQEEWRDIGGYEGLYQISNIGNVKSLGRLVNYKNKGKKWQEGKILKPLNKRGYLCVGLWKNGYIKNYSVHRLVAQAFIPNPNNLPQVNHKNEIKDDNRVENLEWCNNYYNSQYGTRNKRIAEKMKGRHLSEETRKKISKAHKGKTTWIKGKHLSEEHKRKISEANKNGKCSKPVLQIDIKTNEIIKEFPSTREIQRQLGFDENAIRHCCKGITKTSCGFKWQYK